MPENSNNSMEEQLRRYAEERRQGAEFELHQATRNLLQGEVKRVYGGGAGRQKPGHWLAIFWPHLAATMVVAVALAVSIGIFRPKNPQLAVQEKRNQEQLVPASVAEPLLKEPAAPTPNAAEEQVRFVEPAMPAQQEQLKITLTSPAVLTDSAQPELLPEVKDVEPARRERGSPAPKIEIVRQRTTGPEEPVLLADSPSKQKAAADAASIPESRSRFYGAQSNATPRVTSLASAPAGAASEARLAKVEATLQPAATPKPVTVVGTPIQELGAALRLNFVAVTNAAAGGMLASTGAPGFNSFQMEQLGKQVRFIDAAGSTLVGELHQEADLPNDFFAIGLRRPELQGRGVAASRYGAATNAPTPPGTSAAYFKATGLSRVLGKSVVFEGKLFEPANQPSLSGQTNGSNAAPSGRARLAAPSVPSIAGRVVLDSTNQIPVRAIGVGK